MGAVGQIFADPENRQMRDQALARWTGSSAGRAGPAHDARATPTGCV
jgi:hypothetical protein